MYRWIQPETSRYYHAHLVEDLFGDWTLVACWGSLDTRKNRVRKTGVPSYEAGMARIKAIDRRRRLDGYRLVQESTNPQDA